MQVSLFDEWERQSKLLVNSGQESGSFSVNVIPHLCIKPGIFEQPAV